MTTEDILKRAAPFLTQCGNCDASLPQSCTCPQDDYRPVMLDLVREVERLRAMQPKAMHVHRASCHGPIGELQCGDED